jgi:uncharacterized protein (DUF433 family)
VEAPGREPVEHLKRLLFPDAEPRYDIDMPQWKRITLDPSVMGGKPCIRGMRVTAGMIVGLIASGRSTKEILNTYPYLEARDIQEALAYAAWRLEEVELPLATASRS